MTFLCVYLCCTNMHEHMQQHQVGKTERILRYLLILLILWLLVLGKSQEIC